MSERQAFEALKQYERDSVIEFLKTLQVLPLGTKSLFVDEQGTSKLWPPARWRTEVPSQQESNAMWLGSGGFYEVQRLNRKVGQKRPSVAPEASLNFTKLLDDYRIVVAANRNVSNNKSLTR